MSSSSISSARNAVAPYWVRQWRAAMRFGQASVNRRILLSILTVGTLMGLARGAGLLKELMVAKSFGTSDALDAFLMAFLIPSVAINVVGGSFHIALIPAFTRVREQHGLTAATQLASNVLAWSVGLLFCAMALLGLAAPWLLSMLAGKFGHEKLALTQALFYLMLPSVMICGITTIWSAVLNAQGCLSLPTLRVAITPLVTVLALLTLQRRVGIYAIAVATVVGFCLEAAVLASALRRRGISPWPRWQGYTPGVKAVISEYAPAAAAMVVSCGATFVDQAMAARLGSGAVSTLSYGYKVAAILLSVGGFAVRTAVFPHFSMMVATRDWRGLGHTFRVYSRLVVQVSLCLTVVSVCASEPLVRLLYERGQFTSADTLVVSRVQQAFMLQLTPALLSALVMNLISALGVNKLLFWGSAITLTLDFIGNVVLVHLLGVAGIGLANSLAYSVALAFLAFMLWRHVRSIR